MWHFRTWKIGLNAPKGKDRIFQAQCFRELFAVTFQRGYSHMFPTVLVLSNVNLMTWNQDLSMWYNCCPTLGSSTTEPLSFSPAGGLRVVPPFLRDLLSSSKRRFTIISNGGNNFQGLLLKSVEPPPRGRSFLLLCDSCNASCSSGWRCRADFFRGKLGELVGGFNPSEKYARQNGNLHQIGVKIKKCLKPLPSRWTYLSCSSEKTHFFWT